MKKSLKILVLSFICLFAISSSCCLAINIDMNLSDNVIDASSNTTSSVTSNSTSSYSNSTNSSLNSNTLDDGYDQFGDEEYSSNTTSNMVYQNTSKTDATTGSNIADRLQALPESELGLTNILNILLIAVGVVLETLKQIEAQMCNRYYKGFLSE